MSVYYVSGIPYSDELYHFGIKGQKWGLRLYQNPDGSYTEAGKERYKYRNHQMDKVERKIVRKMDKFAAKSEKSGEKALDRLKKLKSEETKAESDFDAHEKDANSDLLARHYQRKAEKYMHRMNAGSRMLKSYRKMSAEDQRSINQGNWFSKRYELEAIKSLAVADMYVNDSELKNMDRRERRRAIKSEQKAMKKYSW